MVFRNISAEKSSEERVRFVVCAFTGHRPHKLPWGHNEQEPGCLAVKQMLDRRLQEAYTLGCRTFLCGMAQGCDTYFAEAVLALRQEKPDVALVAMIPWPGQADGWKPEARLRYERLCAACDRVEILEPAYSHGCALRRNSAMVRRAQVLISVYDGTSGGTGNTVRQGEKSGLTILPVWL